MLSIHISYLCHIVIHLSIYVLPYFKMIYQSMSLSILFYRVTAFIHKNEYLLLTFLTIVLE